MYNKYKNMTESEMEKEIDRKLLRFGISTGLLIVGYVIGRLTAVDDLQKGKLNEFIPKH